MKLTLFSQELNNLHLEKLKQFFSKPLTDVKFLFINTPAVYKPYKPDWLTRCENQWRKVFPKFQEFDLKHAYEVDQNFDFNKFYNDFDFIYVSGGNLYILSYWMKKTNSDSILEKLTKQNKIVYGGESAGAIFAFKDLEPYQLLGNPEKAIKVNNIGMSLLDFAPLPHWENQDFKEGLEKINKILLSKGYRVITITDKQGCFVDDDKIEVI